MYSVVIMMAMTGAPETPAFNGAILRSLHCGYSSCYSSCYGCYGSCYGGSCYGGSYYRGCSGCYGGPSYYSSCCGCWSTSNYSSCTGYMGGTYSSWGSCTGYGAYGAAGYGWPTPTMGSGCGGGYGYGYSYPGMAPSSVTPGYEQIPAPKGGMSQAPLAPGQAKVVVRLPADATLYADGVATNLASSERTFITPVLEKGKEFQYQMKIEYRRDGKLVSESKRVIVRADSVSTVDFPEVTARETVTSKVTVKLPEGAKLYVDGQATQLPNQKEFRTPELIKGNEYVYLFKAELSVNGSNQAQTQRVVFKGGDAVTVDFSEMVDTTRISRK